MSPHVLSTHAHGPAERGAVHACAFFDGEDAERAALVPFARECVDCGERCMGFAAAGGCQQKLRQLEDAGLAVPALRSSGQLDWRSWQDSVLQGGAFDLQRTLGLFDALATASPSPFGATRLWANMEWALSGAPGTERLVEFESRVNEVLRGRQGLVTVCVYDLRRHSALLLADILSTHPMLLVDGALTANPMYVPAPQFLPEYARRQGASA